MERILALRNIMSKQIITFYCVFISLVGYSQNFEHTNTIAFPNPDKISVDRYGNLYVSDLKGNIQRFDKNGKKESVYSPQKIAKISLVEAWNTVKIFVFYKDLQEYVLLDRFMAGTPNIKFDMNSVGFARCATFSTDNSIWLVDDVDFSLKRVDINTQKVLTSNPLQLVLPNQDYEISFMREYQNMLFVVDKLSGVLVFDNLGNFKKKLRISNLDFISFNGNSMYFIQDNQLVLFDLYTAEESKYALPIEKVSAAILFENKLITLSPKGIDLFNVVK
jgi:hypothetical protein